LIIYDVIWISRKLISPTEDSTEHFIDNKIEDFLFIVIVGSAGPLTLTFSCLKVVGRLEKS